MKKSNCKFISNSVKIQEKIIVFLLFLLVIIVFLQVLCRYIFKIPFMWGQEGSIYCFVWIVITSSAIATAKGEHFRIEFILNKLSAKGRKIMNLINYTLMLSYSFLFLVKGWEFSIMGLSRYSSALGIPQFWLFISMPIAGFFMTIYLISLILNELLLFSNNSYLHKKENKTNESSDNFI